jgi:flagellar M-ring protein FliF
MDSFRDSLGRYQLGAAILALSPGKRLALLAAVLFVVGSTAVVGWWSSRPRLVLLADGLEYAESARISERLKSAGVAVTLAGAGTQLRVAERDYARARMELASAGISPSGSSRPGLEIFDKPSWGITDFAQRVNYRRALEGEIERSIARLQGVRSVSVHITLPEHSPFRRSEREASASVTLDLRAGHTPTRETIQGITYLVASSVERLPSEKVTILDTSGRVLSAPSADGPMGMADRRLEYRRQVERDMGQKVSSLLEGVVGVGNVRVEVSAMLDFDHVIRRSESFDPERQVILSEQNSEVSVVPATPQVAASNSSTTNYQNTFSIESVEKATGGVTRLSVAVLLNERGQEDMAAAAMDMGRIEDLVRGAVGYDEARGDVVVVRGASFGEPRAAETAERDLVQLAENYSREMVGILAVLLLALFAWRIVRMARAAVPVVEVMVEAEVQEEDVEEVPEEQVLPDAPAEPPPPTEEQMQYQGTLKEAKVRSGTDSEAAVRLVHSWIRGS